VGAHEIVISADDRPAREELIELYDAVGWTTYTIDPDLLVAALAGSTRVVTARYGEDLLGLARVISDGATIAYLQDVLVRPELQREGVGRQLVQAALEPFERVRQKVLLTDDEPRQRAFYESLGYTELREHGDGRLRAFVRFDDEAGPAKLRRRVGAAAARAGGAEVASA
jgi:GNAT superfamily N-acetyltransferase